MPIATLTLNPAVDVTYEIERLIRDQKAHADATRFDPGGNGINVGRALKRLDVTASNVCLLAGETGQFLERLLGQHIDDPVYVWVDGETRINATILESETATQYEVSGIGPQFPQTILDSLRQRFVGRVGNGYGVVTGSVPPGVSEDVYATFIHPIRAAGGRPVLDAHGALLRRGIEAKPFLIKPNLYELELITGRKLTDIRAVATEAQRIRRSGVDHVCVSLGKEGALLTGTEGTYHAIPPKVKVRSSVGAGDSMVGGLVAGFAREDALDDILRLAVACSVGTVGQPGTELFDPEDLQELSEQIEIRVID
ncbi:MAG: 1-phosphofructokinase family hexose kinase [Methylothermaceae bacterium]|nr:1-phosphofructokinase family hexose kinase [Methylothermaceae bacterium]